MGVIIRLQNLPLSAISIDIRNFFHGLAIPDGGVHIVGGSEGDAFIAFSTDEDARQAMQLSGQILKGAPVRLSLSSRNEMCKVIEQAKLAADAEESSQSGHNDVTNSPQQFGQGQISNPVAPSNSTASMPQMAGMGMLGMNMNGTNFFGQRQNPGMMQSMNSGMNGFPNAMGMGNSLPLGVSNGSQVSGSGSTGKNPPSQLPNPNANSNTTPFGMPTTLAGMGINFPHLLTASTAGANGMSDINPAIAMMSSMGLPSSMMGLAAQSMNPFNSTAQSLNLNPQHQMAGMNSMTSPIASSMASPNNDQMHQKFAQQNSIRPTGFPGMNRNFMNSGPGMNTNIRPPPGPRGPPPHLGFRGRNPNMGVQPGTTQRSDTYGRSGDGRIRSPTRDRRDKDGFRREDERRKRSRSRSRSRDRERRRRSRSRSRSPKSRPSSARRDSREKDDRRRGDSSPDRSRGNRRESRDIEIPPTPFNTTEEYHPAIKLTGVPIDASYRELKEFLRVDVMGGGDGVVRFYDEGIAYVKLERASDYPRAYRSNGRRLRESFVSMEGITIERWVDEYKLYKIRVDQDEDRDKDKERYWSRERHGRDSREERTTERSDRGRQSRFNSVPESSYINIRNLPATATNREVTARLLNGIPVIDVAVVAGPASSGRHTSVAHVKLESPDVAQQAIDMIVRSHEGSQFVVEVSSAQEFESAKSRTGGGTVSNNRLEPADATSIFDLESGLDDDSCSIVIKGAPPMVKERDVYDLFSDIGVSPVNVKIMYDTNGTCNGQVICEFTDPHQARRATTKDGMLFGRGHVQVELIPSERRRMGMPAEGALGNRPQQNSFRPSLLGPRPMNAGGGPQRFGVPPGPNPFVQALQGEVGGGPRHPGPRIRGPNPRHSGPGGFARSNGVDRDERHGGGGRGRGVRHGAPHTQPQPATASDASFNFGKPGCVIGLENVPYKASMDDILNFLSSVLKIDISRDRIIRRFDEADKPTGDARVAFDTAAEATLAHDRLVGTKMWNRLISYTIL